MAQFNQLRILNQSDILTKDQWKQIATTYRPKLNTGIAVNKAKNFLKKDEVKTLVDGDLRQIMEVNGINLPFIVKEQKELLELTKENKQYAVTQRVIEGLKNDLGLNTKVKVTETRTQNSNLADNYQKAVKQTKKVTIETEQSTANTETQDNTTNE